jgi:hypothetical protein
MSLRQLEYIQYYIKAMKLIQPEPEAIQRYRDALDKLQADEREREETDSQDLSEDEDGVPPIKQVETAAHDQDKWQFDVAKLADVPLPSSKYFVSKHHLLDVASLLFPLSVLALIFHPSTGIHQARNGTRPQGRHQEPPAVLPTRQGTPARAD